MSFTFDITAELIPDDELEAWKELERLRDLECEIKSYGDSPGEHFLPLYQVLTARYPCIMTPEGEDSPWADGPLIHNFGKKHTILALSYSRVEDSFPFIIKTATDMGFTVFDPQDGKIHRPMNWQPSSRPAVSTRERKKPWWKIW